ncbi:unnamed protein product [Didymodactylos carnosus]|uniref:Uncharacterized protein n=1 Tax=Didymodactylos carnosus TaxID=1234261 RepID=A0A814GM88_9BILA|nr:unnamed protein product [Didymodactylos carnosus]CAF3769913.1 unnamed protein product [Didymodactylos carnosus]
MELSFLLVLGVLQFNTNANVFGQLPANYILFLAPHERGHLNPILEIAKQLTFSDKIKEYDVIVAVPSLADVKVAKWVTNEGLQYLEAGTSNITLENMHNFALYSQKKANYFGKKYAESMSNNLEEYIREFLWRCRQSRESIKKTI